MTRSVVAPPRERGATLIVGMIMLVVIMLMVLAAFRLSSTDLQAVGNMQFRNEATAAANRAVEQNIQNLPFTTPDVGSVYINNDPGSPAYPTTVAPACIRESIASIGPNAQSECIYNLDGTITCPTGAPAFATVWDMRATVTDANSGSSIVVHHGVAVFLNQTQCNNFCAPALGLATCS